jgi:RNA polymerase sigma-54 factor
MSMHIGMGQRQDLSMRPSPSLIAFAEILAYTGVELQDAILMEVADNPALDLAERNVCPACGDFLLEDGTCYRCGRGEDLARTAERDLQEPDEDDYDVLTHVADQRSLEEHLLLELGTILEDTDLPAAEYLIGELDDTGFLETPLDLVAGSVGVPVERVEHVLAVLQRVGPLGLGARNVRECLLIQLDRWEELGQGDRIARTMVEDHLEELGRGKYGQIARALGVEHDEVIAARDFIRAHLRPYPIAEASDLEPWEHGDAPGYIAPDVVVRIDDEGAIDVEVVESRRFALSINPMYRELVSRLEQGAEEDAKKGLSTDDRDHIQAQVSRARQFLTHIQERRDTLRRVTAYVMARQEAFLRKGPRYLAPLTRAEVAEALSLHESTISRAVGGKYVLLPSRQIVPYSDFFKAALSVHDVLREIVDNESTALTDSELVDELASRGYKIARRTVAKYRNEMGILPSSMR